MDLNVAGHDDIYIGRYLDKNKSLVLNLNYKFKQVIFLLFRSGDNLKQVLLFALASYLTSASGLLLLCCTMYRLKIEIAFI